MAVKRIIDLVEDNSPDPGDYVAVDNSSPNSTRRTRVDDLLASAGPGVFASAAQGDLADTALQPASIGTDVQAYSANLATLSGTAPGASGLAILAAATDADALNILDDRILAILDPTNWITYPTYASLVVGGDWGPAFNAAMAARRCVIVPAGDYLIKTQIVTQQEAQSVVGLGPPMPNANLAGSVRLIYDATLGATPMFHLKHTGHLNRLAFKGPAKGTGTAVLAKKDLGTAYDDTDADITECTFDSWQLGVQHWNRGLRFQDNLVALCTRAVKLEGYDIANITDDPANPFDGLDEGFRAIFLINNRIHATDIAFENQGLNNEKLRGLLVLGNRMDIGDALWIGGLYSGEFIGNVIDQTSAAVGFANFTSAVVDVSLIGNKAKGDPIQGLPFQFVEFAAAVTIITAIGNTFIGATAYGVNFSGPVAGGSMTGGSFQAIGTAGNTTRACLRAQSSLTNLAISGIYFDPTTDAYCVRGTAGQTWTGVAIVGNTWNRSRVLAGIFTDGGNNTIQQDALQIFSGSATYDPPSLADGAGASTTVTATGAALGDFATASFSLSTQGITVTANVTAANTVTVRFQNETGGVLDLGSGTLKVIVQKTT